MTDKTVDFLEHIASMNELRTPLDKETLLNMLAGISKEQLIWDYIDISADLIKVISLWRDILSCRTNRTRCETLLTSINEEQLINLSKIVVNLKHADELNDFDELISATYNQTQPSDTRVEKATQLLAAIRSYREVDFDKIAKELLITSIYARFFGEILFHFNKNKSDSYFISSMAKISEKEIDHLMQLIHPMHCSTTNIEVKHE